MDRPSDREEGCVDPLAFSNEEPAEQRDALEQVRIGSQRTHRHDGIHPRVGAADVVPLVGENRILVRHGLRLLRRTRWAGLRALITSSGLRPHELRAGQVGFVLAPRLNAAGRIGEASDGLRLLLTDDEEEARILADRLSRLNQERQELDQRILEEAIEAVERVGGLERRAGIVLGGDGWHPGVVGIVASRLVERYGRPAFLVGFDGEVGKGSGRSISRFDLHGALHRCAHLLERFGGHRMAAGLTVRRERFDAFRDHFEQVAAETLRPEELGPEQRIDLEVTLMELTEDEENTLRHYQLLSAKPLVVAFNVGEGQEATVHEAIKGLVARGIPAFAVSAPIEEEIAQLDPADQPEFLASLGLQEPASAKVIRAVYEALGLITFFTAGENETRAWPLRRVLQGGRWTIHDVINRSDVRNAVRAQFVLGARLERDREVERRRAPAARRGDRLDARHARG